VSASVYRVGGAGFVKFCFGFHDFHRELLDSLRPATAKARCSSLRCSALCCFSPPPCAESPYESPPLTGQGGLIRVGSSIAVTPLKSSRRSSPGCLLSPRRLRRRYRKRACPDGFTLLDAVSRIPRLHRLRWAPGPHCSIFAPVNASQHCCAAYTRTQAVRRKATSIIRMIAVPGPASGRRTLPAAKYSAQLSGRSWRGHGVAM
jgi:hypothetical protein